MNDLERFLIERACERLIMQFALFNDRREFDSLSKLFASDGQLARPFPPFRRCQGPAAIRLEMEQTLSTVTTRHVCSNLLIDVVTPDTASSVSYFTVYREDELPPAEEPLDFQGTIYLGEYHDQFIRATSGWQFALRDTLITRRIRKR